jgi:Esterase-like activity of phytase
MTAQRRVAGSTLLAVSVAVAAGCGKQPTIDKRRAAELLVEVPVDTANGLSGLAADHGGALWAVAERDARAYRITLDAGHHDSLAPKIETFEVRGVPEGTDLEGLAVLDHDPVPTHFALGTEGQLDGKATVLMAERQGQVITVTSSVDLPSSAVGIDLKQNQGAEGVCGDGDTVFVAIEGAGVDNGKRWAPVVRVVGGKVTQLYRVWLTSARGKLSGLDCRVSADGSAAVLAIERHFEVTKILRFNLLASTAGGTGIPRTDLLPEVALDLSPVLRSGLNLEGIAWTEDGRIAAVVDNQWTTITGKSELVVFKPGVVKVPTLPPGH